MSAGSARYRVVFWGEVTLGNDATEVAQRFAKWFRVQDPAILKKLFSGRLLTLKRGLGYKEAQLYADVIRGLGAMCRLEPERPLFSGAEVRRPARRPAVLAAQPPAELKLLEEGDIPDQEQDGPFAARDLTPAAHPPARFGDPRGADQVVKRRLAGN